MPQAPVKSSGDSTVNTAVGGWSPDILMELLKSFHRIGGAGQPCAISLGNWTRDFSQTGAPTAFGSFCVGLEMESFSNKNDVSYFFR
jgi:hypothetical protein